MAPTNGTATATSPRRPAAADARDERPVRLGPAREDTMLLDWLESHLLAARSAPHAEPGCRWALAIEGGATAGGRSLRAAARSAMAEVRRRRAEGTP